MQRPRPYQEEALQALEDKMLTGSVRRGLVAMPTGTGKTQVFVWFTEMARDRYGLRPALVIAHREELIEQAANRFASVDPMLRVGIEKAHQKVRDDADVIVASIQSIGREGSTRHHLWPSRPKIVIIDEAHHAAADSYKRVCQQLGCFNPNGPLLLGFTATPKRFDKASLHDARGKAVFESVVYNYSIRDAIEDGWLCPLRGYRVITHVDLSDVGVTAGDFNVKQLAKAVDHPIRTEQIYQEWAKVAPDRRTLGFGVDVNHARDLAEVWQAHGVPAALVHGKQHPEFRREQFERFKAGDVRFLANCEVATEGVDVPFCDCIVMARPTKSWGMYVQMVGRGTRLSPGKDDCIILDAVDNCGKHDICTLPAILDLPPSLDLQGRTIKQADELATKLGARITSARLPSTFEALENLALQAVNLTDFSVPAEVARHSHYTWLPVHGGYMLSCGNSGNVHLKEDVLGGYSMIVTDRKGGVLYQSDGSAPDLPTALRYADRYAARLNPRVAGLSARNSKWRKDRPTDKQVGMLKRMRVSPDIIAQLDKGGASDLITKMLSEKG